MSAKENPAGGPGDEERESFNAGDSPTGASRDCQTWEEHRADPQPVETWVERRARRA